jgi:hypothetical protein
MPTFRPIMPEFFKVGDRAYRLDDVRSLDAGGIEDLECTVEMVHGETLTLVGNDAIQAVMLMQPNILEGKRLRWMKHAWAIHNLVGHPLMQILSWLRCYKQAMRVHHRTIPAPVGRKAHPMD